MYVELKTGYDDNGPAWIGWVRLSRSGRTAYYRGRTLVRYSGPEGSHYDAATGEVFRLSTPQEDVRYHRDSLAAATVDEDARAEYRRILDRAAGAPPAVAGHRSPQEKKALSYARDRRNSYGGNDKSSRKNIRRGKRMPHRADRHRAHQVLTQAQGSFVDGLAELTEQRLAGRCPKRVTGFRKVVDQPLGGWVIEGLTRRVRKGINTNEPGTRARIERIRRRNTERTKRYPTW